MQRKVDRNVSFCSFWPFKTHHSDPDSREREGGRDEYNIVNQALPRAILSLRVQMLKAVINSEK